MVASVPRPMILSVKRLVSNPLLAASPFVPLLGYLGRRTLLPVQPFRPLVVQAPARLARLQREGLKEYTIFLPLMQARAAATGTEWPSGGEK